MSCVAFGCYKNSSKKIAGITFHRFPKEEILRKEWAKAVKRDNWNPSKHSVLCSEHFEESDFDKCSTFRVYLKPNVVPSVFKAFPKHLQKVKHTRRPIHRQLSLEKVKAHERANASTICIATDCIDDDSESVPVLQAGNSSEVQLEETNASVSEGQTEVACLKRKLEVAEASVQNCKKKIKLLQQTNRRNQKKISDLKSLMKECKNKGLITDDSLQILYKAAGPNKELITRQLCKVTNSPIAKFYSPELRKFALTLHFYSPRAYNYVRESFNSCLPHPRTIGKWYQHVEVEPGFTSQAMKALKRKVDSSEMPLFFALVFDEMAIRQHVEFDGSKFHGYIDVGVEIDDDALPIAREAMVFMVVCINAHFKIPVGYFLCSGLTSEQKANLLQHCLIQLHDHHVNIVSCTFDGLSSNLSMAKQLGCNFKSIFPPKPKCPSKQDPTTSLALDVQDDNIEFQSFEDIEFEWTDEDEENFVQPSSTQQESKKKINIQTKKCCPA
ncbi:hypothetical protein JTE90_014540 [Oedothorax gibbosus]|uniref:THAP-type domain-containing protein n=1 Tax=Oedothorax gibbosus TaxID=931172 RepID=A0AAV6TQE8_9ARAC|nr:hypothetical protein JTE90_014540 [Oedothorax gibbosus]